MPVTASSELREVRVLLANDGEFTRGNYGLFVGSSLATTVWVLMAGVLLWRRAQTAS